MNEASTYALSGMQELLCCQSIPETGIERLRGMLTAGTRRKIESQIWSIQPGF